MRVRDLMTEGVFVVGVEDDLETVTNLMDDRNIRHAPVVDGAGNLVGLVTQRDLLRTGLASGAGQLPPEAERQARLHVCVGEIMNPDVVTARPDQDIRDAARIMLDNKFGCLPVVEDHRLVGIVTESDFVRLMASGD